MDSSGSAVPGAEITATSTTAGTKREATSGADGQFAFYAVPIGQYILNIVAAGFANAAVNAVQVNAGATSNLDQIKLALPIAASKVEVNGAASALLKQRIPRSPRPSVQSKISNLPLNNGFDTVTEVVPGIVSTHGDNFSNTNGDNYLVNGQSGRYNNSEIDGQSNNDNGIGGPQVSSVTRTRFKRSRSFQTTLAPNTDAMRARSSTTSPSPAPTHSTEAALSFTKNQS